MRIFGRICQLAILGLLVFASPVRADLARDCDSDNDELAIKACTLLIKQNPRNPTTFFNRGISYQNLGRHQEALEDYNAAIRLNPKEADYFHNRATAYDRLGELDRTIEDCNTALKLRPNDNQTIGTRAWARARANKELKEALADMDRLLKVQSKNAAPFVTRSLIHFRLGDWKNAIADANASIKLYAESEDGFYIRGLAKIASGEVKDGNDDLASARKINPDIADYYAKYGVK
jgi:tetratricopeptide (TPR) repeat protein